MSKQISNGVKKTILWSAAVIIVLLGIVWLARPKPPVGGEGGVARTDSQNQNISPLATSMNGTLTAEESGNYDFGKISMAAGKVKHEFKIKNTSSEAITIGKMYTSCMCTTAELILGDPSTSSGQVKRFGPYGMPGHGVIPKINQAVNPSEEVIVEVVFNPAAHGPAGVGRIQRTITLENNAGKPIELGFTAMVTP